MSLPNSIVPSQWVEKYADALFAYAIVRVSEREAARDLVQDTFLSALQSINSFRGESSEKTWLFTILKNKIIDRYRKNATEKSIPLPEEEGFTLDTFFEEHGEWKIPARPHDWHEAPSDNYRSREFLEVLYRCLGKLKDQARALFTLKYLEEQESEEICKELGLSSSNYWVMMHRAKLALRHCVEKNWLNA